MVRAIQGVIFASVVLAFSFAPAPVHAQEPPQFMMWLNVQGPGAPDPTPPGEIRWLLFEVEATCRPDPTGSTAHNNLYDATNLGDPTFWFLHYAETEAPWIRLISAEGVRTVAFSTEDCLQERSQSVYVEVAMQVLPDAPAFAETWLDLHLDQPYGPNAAAGVLVRAGFAGDFHAASDATLGEVHGGEAFQVDVHGTNNANGPILLRVQNASTTLPGTTFALPGEEIVAGRAVGLNTIVLTIDAQTTAPVGSVGLLVIDLTAQAADDPSIWLPPQRVQSVLHVTTGSGGGDASELPAPNMVLPGLVVFGLAAFLRRRII